MIEALEVSTGVMAGSTLGMMLANVPVVLFGDHLTRRLPMVWVRGVAAALFALLGMGTLLDLGRFL